MSPTAFFYEVIVIAKIRNLKYSPAFEQTHKTNFENLLVSGCSYVWNNSQEHVCTWPYVLKDLCNFKEVFDCSQSGAGPNHVFNSIINEIETNTELNPDTTLVIVMWPELHRTDVITSKDLTSSWHHMSNYAFNDRLATLSLAKQPTGRKSMLEQLCIDYTKLVDSDGQILESIIKAKALRAYLKDKNFNSIFLSWKQPTDQDFLPLVEPTECLDNYTERKDMRIPNDGHPTPDAHYLWTVDCLIPLLENKQFIMPI